MDSTIMGFACLIAEMDIFMTTLFVNVTFYMTLACGNYCSECSSVNDCQLCLTGYVLDKKENRDDNKAECITSCREGYYSDGLVCQSI